MPEHIKSQLVDAELLVANFENEEGIEYFKDDWLLSNYCAGLDELETLLKKELGIKLRLVRVSKLKCEEHFSKGVLDLPVARQEFIATELGCPDPMNLKVREGFYPSVLRFGKTKAIVN